LRRACTMSLFLWLALECVLLGAAAGYRPLKDRALHFENSLWLDEVLPVREHGILLLFASLYLFVCSFVPSVFRIPRMFLHLVLFHSFLH
jgi:hypothetical protein